MEARERKEEEKLIEKLEGREERGTKEDGDLGRPHIIIYRKKLVTTDQEARSPIAKRRGCTARLGRRAPQPQMPEPGCSPEAEDRACENGCDAHSLGIYK